MFLLSCRSHQAGIFFHVPHHETAVLGFVLRTGARKIENSSLTVNITGCCQEGFPNTSDSELQIVLCGHHTNRKMKRLWDVQVTGSLILKSLNRTVRALLKVERDPFERHVGLQILVILDFVISSQLLLMTTKVGRGM